MTSKMTPGDREQIARDLAEQHQRESKPHSAPAFNGREARKIALVQHDGSGSVWDVLAFKLLEACDHIERLEEQLDVTQAALREAVFGFIGYAFPEDDPEEIIENVLSGFMQSGQLRLIAERGSNPAKRPT